MGHFEDNLALINGPVSTFVVLVIPVHRDLWYSGSRHVKVALRAGQSFRAAGLPPGDYVVTAVNSLDPLIMNGEVDPELLESLSARGTRVSLAERDRRTIDLRLIRR